MGNEEQSETRSAQEQFSRDAEERSPGLVRELWGLIRQEKKWWLVPIVVVLLVIGILILLGTTAAAPFIYSLF